MWEGLKEIQEEVSGVEERLARPEPFLREVVGPFLREVVGRNIQAGGRPPYPPLEPTTQEARRVDTRRRQLHGDTPLAGGPLEESYTGGPGHIERVEGNSLIFGSEFGAIHEYGGTHEYPISPVRAKALKYVGWVGAGIDWTLRKHVLHPPLPERSVLTVPDGEWERLNDMAERYLEESV